MVNQRERSLRVALLTSAKSWRGSGVSLAKIATGLAARDHQPRLLAGAAVIRDTFGRLGLPTSYAPTGDTGLRQAWELRQTLDAMGTDIVLADKPRDLRLAALATFGRPTAILYRYNLNAVGPPLGVATRLLFHRVSGCIYQAERVRQRAIERNRWLGHARSWVIPNGYDVELFRPDVSAGLAFRLRYGIGTSSVLVLSAGALEPGKGHDVALAALRRVVTMTGAELVYVLCGAGGYEAELRAAAERAGVETRLVGFLGTQEFVGALNAADLIVHPSREDIFPNAVGEAMACARPVVATDVGGVGELVDRDGTAGLLVPPDDASALADAISWLLADPGRRATVGEAARRRIETQFSLHRMVDAYEAALQATSSR